MKNSPKIEVHRKAKIPWRLGSVWFNVGVNKLTLEQYNLIKDHPILMRQIETGAKEVFVDGKRVGEAEPKEVTEIVRRQKEEREAKKKASLAKLKDEALDGEPQSRTGESPLGSLNVKDAQALIEASESLEELESWKAGEPRKTILQAIEARIQALKAKGAA